MMDWRTILAVVIMVGIYYLAFPPRPAQLPAPTNVEETSAPTPVIEKRLPLTKQDAAASQLIALREKNFELSNDVLRVKLNGLGVVQEYELKNYADAVGSKKNLSFISNEASLNEFNLSVRGEAPLWRLGMQSENSLELVGDSGGLQIRRRLSLEPGEYAIRVRDSVQNLGDRSVEMGLETRIQEKIDSGKQVGFFKKMFFPQAESQLLAWFSDGSLNTKMAEEFEKKPKLAIEELVKWFGFSSRYFLVALAPTNSSISAAKVELKDRGLLSAQLDFGQKQIPPTEENAFEYALYLGPKKLADLEKIGPELGRAIDYGNWIGPIARLMLSLLTFFYSLIPNFGVAIILLTLLVKIVLFPLAYKAAYSMRKLSLVAPKMKELRDKYKGDQQRLSAEMMTLYKKEKVNPFGGCLPLLAQMPVFFALYRVFFASIEMRNEPFIFWIQDLSTYDPFFVTPILMVALMWFQQKITPMPSTGDDENEAVKIQKAMFKWMPFIFGAIMIFLPSGLTLYFLVNAALSIAQQYWMNKRLDVLLPRPELIARPAPG